MKKSGKGRTGLRFFRYNWDGDKEWEKRQESWVKNWMVTFGHKVRKGEAGWEIRDAKKTNIFASPSSYAWQKSHGKGGGCVQIPCRGRKGIPLIKGGAELFKWTIKEWQNFLACRWGGCGEREEGRGVDCHRNVAGSCPAKQRGREEGLIKTQSWTKSASTHCKRKGTRKVNTRAPQMGRE